MKQSDYKAWVRAAIIRAIKTMAQVLGSMISIAFGMDPMTLNWKYILATTLLAGVWSLVMSCKGLPESTYDGTVQIQDDGYAVVDASFDINNITKEKIIKLKLKK